jgi:hypothetical protein
MKTYTIIDRASDREYKDTLLMLVLMIDNCNNTETKDYDIVVERRLADPIRINFEKFLQLDFNIINEVRN